MLLNVSHMCVIGADSPSRGLRRPLPTARHFNAYGKFQRSGLIQMEGNHCAFALRHQQGFCDRVLNCFFHAPLQLWRRRTWRNPCTPPHVSYSTSHASAPPKSTRLSERSLNNAMAKNAVDTFIRQLKPPSTLSSVLALFMRAQRRRLSLADMASRLLWVTTGRVLDTQGLVLSPRSRHGCCALIGQSL
jgi:hypothetical protein